MGLEARRLGTVFHLSGGVLRASALVGAGESYRVWSYVPDPAPRTLASAPVRYPPAIEPFLVLEGRLLPSFGTPDRERTLRALFDDPSYADFQRYRPLDVVAKRVAGRAEDAVRGGARARVLVQADRRLHLRRDAASFEDRPARRLRHADESRVLPALRRSNGRDAPAARDPRLVSRWASRAGRTHDGTWVVTDHDAHAWVEVWFPGRRMDPLRSDPGARPVRR